MQKIYDSLDEFEKEWKEKLEKDAEEAQKTDDEEVEDVETDEDETTTDPDAEDTNEDTTADEEVESTETDEEKATGDEVIEPVKKDKKEIPQPEKVAHSFQKMREETKIEREKALKLEQELKELEAIALTLGYSSTAEFKKAVEEKKIKDEASKLGKDPEVLKEINELKRKQAEFEKEREQVTRKQREEQVYKQMGEFIQENNLTEDEFSKVIELAAADGVGVEDFMQIKGVKTYLKGVASDLIFEKKKQKDLAKSAKKQTLSQEKHIQATPPPKGKSVAELAEEEVMREYGLARGK
jgi:hypothetical protein